MAQQPPNTNPYPMYPWSFPSQPLYMAPPPPPRRTPWALIAVVAVVGVIIVSAIGWLLVRPAVGNFITPSNWVYSDNDDAVYVTWTASDNNLAGVWYETYFNAPSSSVKTLQATITGTRDGNKILFSLSSSLVSGSFTGTVGFRTLTLDLPKEGTGQLVSYVFHPGDQNAYNNAANNVRLNHPGSADTPQYSREMAMQ